MVSGRVGVKFCGGCNPQINRLRIFKGLQQRLPGLCDIIRDEDQDLWDVGILLGGCPVACADSEDIRKRARKWIVVGGAMVDSYSVDEHHLVDVIAEKCELLLASIEKTQ